jgi:hypothetical protein
VNISGTYSAAHPTSQMTTALGPAEAALPIQRTLNPVIR